MANHKKVEGPKQHSVGLKTMVSIFKNISPALFLSFALHTYILCGIHPGKHFIALLASR